MSHDWDSKDVRIFKGTMFQNVKHSNTIRPEFSQERRFGLLAQVAAGARQQFDWGP